ncbi:MAG: M20/M25/M40 family metallo-hydrolase [Desulfobacterota bacterium]|nr:M20/M25/M40 family metallo-hydrolase [Thermodesulfobacteriota bacterium]MDW8001569.1 M20/M25/M40 family metallo-hydrolase [Deltaproteobacteria bacterium]
MERGDLIERAREFLCLKSVNPPGEEEESILYLESFLRKEGIETEILKAAPKRANLYARIRGKRSDTPIVILCHVDTVPAKPEEWEVDPFGGEIKDGYLYGRGAIDMKVPALCQLFAFIEFAKEGLVPERDIVYLATCDEETGGKLGVKLVLEKKESLANAEFVLSEGGFIIKEGEAFHAQISVTEKKVSQFYLKAKGTGGHGSTPHKDNPNEKIIEAASRIIAYKWPIKLYPVARRYIDGILKGRTINGMVYKDIKSALKRRCFLNFLDENPVMSALLKNTVTCTILRGGEKVNVIPTEAEAAFDARILPQERQDKFYAKIKKIVGKNVEVVPVGESTAQAFYSNYNTRYFKTLESEIKKIFGPIPVLPYMTTGATDLRYFRSRGVPSYGFFPIVLTKDEIMRMHGVNERISIENIETGYEATKSILRALSLLV